MWRAPAQRSTQSPGGSEPLAEGVVPVSSDARRVRYFRPPDEAPPNVAPSGWYLSGLIVVPEYRCQGVGKSLIRARLDWIGEHDGWAYYFANAQNRVTINLHQQFGFVEVTRDFTYPGATFVGGTGVLFRARLKPVPGG